MLNTSPGGQSALAVVEKRLVGSNPDDSDVPAPVRKAVRFMLTGGVVTVVTGAFWIIVILINKNAIISASGQKLSSSQFAGGVTENVVFYYLIPAVIWVLMARFNRAGHVWARIVASALCAIDTYGAYQTINSLTGGETITVESILLLVLTFTSWVLGVLAIAFLWRNESNVYFRSRHARD
jgi:hypothetical protein